MYLKDVRLVGALSDGVDCEHGYVEVADGCIVSVGERALCVEVHK